MAKQDFSFDIVSEVSMPEVANAVDQARREIAQRFDFKDTGTRSEEHTSELQSLRTISYAVFCLDRKSVV